MKKIMPPSESRLSSSGSKSAARTHWVCFFLIFTASCLISYSSLSLAAKVWIGLLGVVLPFVYLLAAAVKGNDGQDSPVYGREIFREPPFLFLVFLVFLAAGIRLYGLTTLSVWPLMDDGIHGFLAMELFERWHWRLFSYCTQMPPLYLWMLAGVFRIFGPSLLSLWLLPALLSFVTAVLGYALVRAYFPKSFSFVFGCLLGFGFWMLFIGRLSQPAVLLAPWTILVLAQLGNFWRAVPEKKVKAALILGLATGTGFYTYLPWAAVALFTGLVVVGKSWKEKGGVKYSFVFFGTILICVMPLLEAMVQNGYGGYLRTHNPFLQPDGLAIFLLAPFRYLKAVFWGTPGWFYTSNWGGLLNPFWGSLFWLGWAELFRKTSRTPAILVTLALFIFSLPGILTSTVDPFRVLPWMPVMFFCSVVGFQTLIETLATRFRTALVILLLSASSAVDIYHLLGPYHRQWSGPVGTWGVFLKSLEYSRAFPILDEIRRSEGPGTIFTDFQPNLTDQSLTVAVYPFNTAQNRRLDPSNASWAAFLCNVNFQPFLKRRFPAGRWIRLTDEGAEADGGLMLAVIPVTEANREVWLRWTLAHQAMNSVVSELMRRPEGGTYEKVREKLWSVYPLFKGDPFLESCFWFDIYNYFNSDSAYGNRLRIENFQGAYQALALALKNGYPAANLYNEMGGMEVILKNYSRAKLFFEKAKQSPLNVTPAGDNLRALESLERKESARKP